MLVKRLHEQQNDRISLDLLFTDEDSKFSQIVMHNRPGSPWLNLLDKGLGIYRPGAQGTKLLRFTYDQVFEYLLAEHVGLLESESALGDDEFIQKANDTMNQSVSFPLLWGATKLSILNRASNKNSELLDRQFMGKLIDMPNIFTKSMILDVLNTRFDQGPADFEQVSNLLDAWMTQSPERYGEIGIECAYALLSSCLLRLGNSQTRERSSLLEKQIKRLSDLLEKGMYSTASYMRQLSTQYTLFLWQGNSSSGAIKNLGLDLFQRVRDTARAQLSLGGLVGVVGRRHQGIDSIKGLRSLLDLGLLAISLGYRFPGGSREVGKLLVDLIDRIPTALKILVDRLLIGTKLGEKVIMDGLNHLPIIQIRSMRPFFKNYPVGHPVRGLTYQVANYFDPQKGDLEGELGDIVFKLSHEHNGFTYIVIILAIMPRVADQLEKLYKLCYKLFHEGNAHSKWIALRVSTMACHMDSNSAYCKPHHIDFAEELIFDSLKGTGKSISYPWQETPTSAIVDKSFTISHIGYGCLIEMSKNQDSALNFIAKVLELDMDRSREDRTAIIMKNLKEAVLLGVATTRFNVVPVLKTIETFSKGIEENV